MNLKAFLPFVQQMTGKDFSAELDLFIRSRESFGRAIGPEGQKFVLGHWKRLADFLETEAGAKASREFANAWAIGLYPQLAEQLKPELPKIEVPEIPAVKPEPPNKLF